MTRAAPDPAGPVQAHHPFDVGWRERLLLLGTLGLLLASIFFLLRTYRPAAAVEVLGLIPVTFVAVGKFLPLWGITGQSGLTPYELGLLIWALDTLTVIVFVYSFEAVYRIPLLRRALDRIYLKMQLVLQVYPRMRKASVVSVVLFVLFPVSGTGALAASVIGALIGMNRWVLMSAVSLGGLLGGLFMAFLADNFAAGLRSLQAVQENPANKYWILLGVAVLVGLGIFFLNRMFRRALEEAEKAVPPQ